MEQWGRKLRFRTRVWRGIKYPLLLVSERTMVILALVVVIAIGTAFAILMMKKDTDRARPRHSVASPAWASPV